MLNGPTLLALALLTEASFGYPAAVFRRIGHPVTWAGALIAWLDRRLNHPAWSPVRRRAGGVVAVVVLVLAAGLPAWALQVAAVRWLPGPLAAMILVIATSTLLAQRSLWDHVRAVERGLRNGLPEGRRAVAHIVGRNPESLDAAGVARAAIESLAENFADGVVAPALWCALLGLPGIVLYKAINTADSMIGHRTERHEAFGWAAARLDDLVNLPASRLAALLLIVAAVPRGRAGSAWRAVARDAGRHRSPNAGWPEAAMAGALGLRLAGPRVYGDRVMDDAWINNGRADPTAVDIGRALRLFRVACAVGLVLVAAVALAGTLAP